MKQTPHTDKSKGGKTGDNLFVSDFISVLSSGEMTLEGRDWGKGVGGHFDEKHGPF